ncbi:MAG: tetratricopeptide repeat protein [Verrucomicrobiales bacterium]
MKHFRLFGILAVALLSLFTGCSKQKTVAKHLARGDEYREDKKFEEARIEYLNAQKIDPASKELSFRLGGLFFESGDLRQAAPLLIKQEKLEPDNLEVKERLAQIYLEAHENDQARAEALTVLEGDPDRSMAPLILADAATTQDEMDAAENVLQRLESEGKSSVPISRALGSLKLRRGDWTAAEELFRKAQAANKQDGGTYLDLARLAALRGDGMGAEQALRLGTQQAPSDTKVRLALAGILLMAGKLDDGTEVVRKVTAEEPKNPDAWFGLARLAFAASKFEECSQYVRKVLRLNPEHVNALILEVRLRARKGENALPILTELERDYPRLAKIRYEAALWHIGNNDLSQASTSLSKALSIDPDFHEATLLLAEVKLKNGYPEGAVTTLEPLKATDAPRNRLYPLLIQALRESKSYDKAEEVCHDWLKSRPKQPQALFELGLVLREQGKNNEAMKAFENVLQLAPESETATANLIELDLIGGRLEQAMNRSTRWIQAHSNAGEMRYLQARVLLAQNQTEDAMKTLGAILEQRPALTKASVLLAQIHATLSQHDEAVSVLVDALNHDRNDPAATMLLASLWQQKGEFQKAAASYEELLALQPKFVPAMNNLAALYVEQLDRVKDGLTLADDARNLMPDDPTIAATLGWALFQSKEFSEALPLLEEAAAKLSSNSEFMCRLGICHYMMANQGKAHEILRDALDSPADFPSRPRAEHCMAVLNFDESGLGRPVIQSLKRFIEQDSNDPVALLKLAGASERAGDTQAAKSSFESALDVNPKCLPALMGLSLLSSLHLDDSKAALELARKAQELAPNDATVRHALGRLALDIGGFFWSIKLLKESSSEAPENGEIQLDLAIAQFGSGRPAEAAVQAEAALKKLSGEKAAKAARFLRAMKFLNNPSDVDAAKAEIPAIASKLVPDDIAASMVSGVLLEQAGKYSEARDAYDTLLLRFPSCVPPAKRLAALSLDHLSDYERARELAETIKAILPDDPDVPLFLGKAAYFDNRFSEAISHFLRCKRMGTPDTSFKEMLDTAQRQEALLKQPLLKLPQ